MTPQPAAPRPMRWWDVERLLPLEQELFGPDAWAAETWWGELAQPGRSYVVVDGSVSPDGSLEGYAGVLVNGADADVMTVAVSPDRQGAGLGRLLLDRLVDLAAAQGAHQLLLEVRADNAAAQRLYARSGFERIAVRRGYYRTDAGPVDAWVMRRRPLGR
jgi:[ribosomal protein S18]-alanine N-acetyltransferase